MATFNLCELLNGSACEARVKKRRELNLLTTFSFLLRGKTRGEKESRENFSAPGTFFLPYSHHSRKEGGLGHFQLVIKLWFSDLQTSMAPP